MQSVANIFNMQRIRTMPLYQFIGDEMSFYPPEVSDAPFEVF